MKQAIIEAIQAACKELFGRKVTVELTRPEAALGDWATNVALQLAKPLGKNPRDIAASIAEKLNRSDIIEKTEVAGPGFINLWLSDESVFKGASQATALPQPLSGKVIVAEYSDPNAFKALHAGHLYTTLVGDAIANILETAGAKVHRVNFGGDVGLHVGRAMWGIIKNIGGENPEALKGISERERAQWINARYVEGNAAYETSETAKGEIIEANKKVYKLHQDNDKTSSFARIYWTCRQWSYDGFDALYQELNVHTFDKYYPESAIADAGLETVKKHIGDVYEESDGAIVFRGERYGLFTQVFITSEGLLTYAGKDTGLIYAKHADFKPDISYIITDFAQKDHLAVVMKSIEQFEPELVKNTVHQTHGRIKFADGAKMSSRSGNVVWADDILDAAHKVAQKLVGKSDAQVSLGAVRYSFLKNRIGSDIQYDPEESVSLEGNSGPYLQYALVRARAILRKLPDSQGVSLEIEELDSFERNLARQISLYPEAFEAALHDYSPHHLANYLYELAQTFNRFYENSRVAGDSRQTLRASLVATYEKTLSHGMDILGMPKPEKM